MNRWKLKLTKNGGGVHMCPFGSNGNTQQTASSHSAEALMNAGFLAKEQQRYDEALSAFSNALSEQTDDATTLYLIIEIGSILKSKGSYDEAILLFLDAQKLPALIRNKPIGREFVNMIAYLRITKNVLLARRLSFLPFSQIPADVVKEIDAEYADWNKLEEAI